MTPLTDREIREVTTQNERRTPMGGSDTESMRPFSTVLEGIDRGRR